MINHETTFALHKVITDDLWDKALYADSLSWDNSTVTKSLGIKYNPDKETYMRLSDLGMIRLIIGTEYNGDTSCVAVAFKTKYIQNPLYSTIDFFIFTIVPEYRSIKRLRDFIRSTDSLVSGDTDIVSIGFPSSFSGKAIDRIMGGFGFLSSSTSYTKRI